MEITIDGMVISPEEIELLKWLKVYPDSSMKHIHADVNGPLSTMQEVVEAFNDNFAKITLMYKALEDRLNECTTERGDINFRKIYCCGYRQDFHRQFEEAFNENFEYLMLRNKTMIDYIEKFRNKKI